MIEQLTPHQGRVKTTEVRPAAYVLYHRTTDKYYIGSSETPGLRISRHLTLLKGGRHDNRFMQEAYNLDPEFVPNIYPTQDRNAAYDLEQKLIDHYTKIGRCFNIGIVDVRAPNKGRAIPDHVKEKLRIAKLGKPKSKEAIQKFIKAMTGRKRSEEDRLKISKAKKGVPQPESVRKLLLERIEAQKIKVLIDGLEYESINQAARLLNLNKRTIARRIDSSKWPNWNKA